MSLPIKRYDDHEREAKSGLGNRAIQAFGPVTFQASNWPTRVEDEPEVVRYIDTQHELKDSKYFDPRQFTYSKAESHLMVRVSDIVADLSEKSWRRRIRPLMALPAAIPMFRAATGLARLSDISSVNVFEIGPGSGYLGALLNAAGHGYASMENTQALYLWQNRLYHALAPDRFTDYADCEKPAKDRTEAGEVLHFPWWRYLVLRDTKNFSADIVVCDHALGEISRNGLEYILARSRLMLEKGRIGMLVFGSVGAPTQSKRDAVFRRLEANGFRLVYWNTFYGWVLKDRALAKFALPASRVLHMTLWNRMRNKLHRNAFAKTMPNHYDLWRHLPEVRRGPGEPLVEARSFLLSNDAEPPLDYPFLAEAGVKVPGLQA